MNPPIMIHAPSLLAKTPGSFEIPAGATLEWTQPSVWRSEWSLGLGGRPFATLRRSNWAGWVHAIEAPSGRWTLRYQWIDNLQLSAEGAAEPVLRYRSGWLGNGRILVTDGEELRWRRFWAGPFACDREIQTRDESPLLRFHYRRTLFRLSGSIEVTDLGRRHAKLEALLVLGWALAVLTRHRSHPH